MSQIATQKQNNLQTTFRQVTPEDISLILDFVKELAEFEKLAHEVTATEDNISKTFFGDNPRVHAMIAEVDGQGAGIAIYFYNYSTFQGKYGIYIEDVFVREEYRGLGIGKQFFQKLSQQAVDEDCGRVQWWVLDWNKPAIDFYEKMGAKAMDEWVVYRLEDEAITKVANSFKTGAN